ncbi:hypothetical protein L226DRAFT_512037 [Lentinus tigrinus ALCF2SS1-7]|uniref:uncharacterized protein n=1 Tax=Lentinus tigrinus ALCF2SS1-7 TaxID=1328758 RepID=UPI0011662ED2|nr:hypothetical protein L226DRAFT_512037 [Lentinus tigrinus ALCF2SS1-7]
MADPALPLDLLLTLMETSSRSTTSRMMRTCRLLYNRGARILLGSGVFLSTSEDAISFLRFMLADTDARFPHLRSLKISRGNFSLSGVHALRGLLCHKSLALHTLILMDAESVLLSDPARRNKSNTPSLFMALANLRSLKNLVIDGCDVISFSLLRMMVCSLETASLNLGSYTSWSSITSADDRNPILLLMRSSHTLQELRGSCFDSSPETIKFDVVYPSVRLISASYSSSWMPATLAYINAFPNLEHLSLTCPSHRFEGNGADPNSVLHLFSNRECNLNDQENYSITWEHLQEVSGSVIDLFVLGLVCQVPTVRVLDDISERMCRFLRDVIADMKPTTLVMTVAGSGLFAPGSPMNVVLRQAAAQHLRKLDLEICFAPCEWGANLDCILKNVRDTFVSAGIPLRSLSLTLNYGLLTTPSILVGSSSPFEHACPLEQELLDMARDATRARLLFSDAIRTLKPEDVSIQLSTEREPHQYMLGAVGDREDAKSVDSDDLDGQGSEDELLDEFARFMVEEDDSGW